MKLLILIFLIWVEGEKIKPELFDSIFATIFTTSTEQPLQEIPMSRKPNFDPLPIDETDESETCVCVRYYLCNKNGTLNTSGFNVIEARYTFNLSEPTRRCQNVQEKCCKKHDTKTASVIPLPSQSKGCGVRNKNGIDFHIVGNKHNESQFGEFPWMLAILQKITIRETGKELLAYKCGGSLIHPQVALTSAHCVYSENSSSKFKIRAGEWDTETINEIYPYQDRNVSEIIIHPDFNRLNLEYDVALLVFDTPLDIFEHVDTVCLPSQYEIFENSRCFASGWGKDRFQDNGKYQTILKKLELPIVPRAECQQLLSTTVLGNNFFLGDTFICAGGELRKDTCTGDGGSPLVCSIPGQTNKYYQRGMVSWGVECGKVEIPGVYSNIAAFRSWIDMTMWKLNFDTSTYTAH